MDDVYRSFEILYNLNDQLEVIYIGSFVLLLILCVPEYPAAICDIEWRLDVGPSYQ